jgi:Putative zinc-finger
MCEYSTKLVAWMDREMSGEESAEMERHLENCAECRMRAAKYEEMSRSFEAYCAATVAARPGQKRAQWVPVLSAAAAVVLCVAIGFRFTRPRPEPPTIAFHPAMAQPAVAPAGAPTINLDRPPSLPLTAGRTPAVHKHTARRTPAQAARLEPAEPVIRIAIPADSLFPPGALPEGVDFAADVSFAPDGSAQQMRLRPQLIRFDRRPQP